MPFTPFHFGPGLLIKGVAARWFSWTAFVAAQVVIDCETLYYINRNEYPLHRRLHTFIGATLAGAATAGALVALKWLARRVAPAIVESFRYGNRLMRAEAKTSALLVGGLIGGASHPLFDGLMHTDIMPFLPWTTTNPLLGVVGVGALHVGCLVAGLIGLALLGIWMIVEGDAG